ncbi:MAG: LysR family transcriptional regulator [Proteobacteria bacterium]|nr:LysR family transcriptional regulator [Pseudomonadota bacterium]
MNFHQLQIFYTVAKHKSFTRAAHELLLTQPAVSIQVRQLEEECRTKLFDRVGKKVILTEAGKILHGYAASILNLSKQADSALQDLQGLKAGSLEIGAGLTLGAYYLPEIISRFSADYPHISIRMHLGNSTQVIEEILSFKEDLGFVAQVHRQDQLDVIPFLRETLVAITAPDHALANRRTVSISALKGQRFILRERGSATREVVEKTLEECQVPVNVVMELASNEAIKAAVASGLGASIVSERIVRKELSTKALRIHSFSDAKLERDLYIVHHKDKYLSSPVREFIRHAMMAFG